MNKHKQKTPRNFSSFDSIDYDSSPFRGYHQKLRQQCESPYSRLAGGYFRAHFKEWIKVEVPNIHRRGLECLPYLF